ncbi:hypothetical protein AWC38_SpisGene24034 [Stylophora pistillata]|uniref:Uncharacterized protein n=1 Tax=Stylophora pistillata TaxID=50429 RepID=A0A2B4R717_STYPI|nr:hypothetical protein AWC38_SpisGene24034 [Stylophora pistillata]
MSYLHPYYLQNREFKQITTVGAATATGRKLVQKQVIAHVSGSHSAVAGNPSTRVGRFRSSLCHVCRRIEAWRTQRTAGEMPSSGKQVEENSTNEQSHETSTKTDPNWSLQPSNSVDAGSDQLAELTENFFQQLTVGEVHAETRLRESEHASSRPNISGSLPTEGMFKEDPRPVPPGGASSMKNPIPHSMDPPNHPAVRVVCQGEWVIAKQQESGKPAENTDHNHNFPVEFEGQQTTINSKSEEMRKAKEDLEKKASEVQALERKIEFLEKRGKEFEKRMLEESKRVTKLKQQLNLWKRKCKEVKGKLAQEVKTRNDIEERSNDLCKENNTLLQNATFLTKQFRDEVLSRLQDAQTTNDELRQLLEESAARESEKAELIRKQQQMYHWKEDECQRLKEHIEEKNQQYQNAISEMEKLKKETLECREELKMVMVELNRVLEENSRKHHERLEEASQAFLKAETDSVKEMKCMLAKEKQRVERLKRAMATLKINGVRIKKRTENVYKDSDEEECFDCQPDRPLDT